MTGTRNPSRKYFKRNQPYFYKSVDNWEEWDTDESYDRTFFIGIDDSDPENIDVALYMIWGGKAIAVVGSKVLDTVSDVVGTAKLLEEEIQSILEEVQEITVALAQARIDIEEAITEMNALIDRCEGILDGAEAARDLAQAWAVKMDGMVEEDGQPVDYSAKYYANEAKNSETAAAGSATTASASATTATEQATAASTSAEQAATSASTAASYASTAHIDASGAANSATSADTSATNAANSATASANSATASAASAQAAQDALDDVHGLIATPIGTIFQSVYVDESLDMARALTGQLISSTKFTGFRSWLNKVQTAIPNLFTTETNWQAEKAQSKFGQVGKFVIDDTAGTIRLPAVVNPQGLLSLSGIGNLVNESLPNIMGKFGSTIDNTNEGAFAFLNQTGTATYRNTGEATYNHLFDASLSSSTYQTGAPVQQEAIQYPYYIQVATGIEETLPAIREYEINTPFFFGQSQYFEVAPYNASWLASNGQYNSSTVYPDMYTQLNSVELNSSLNVGDTIEISGKTYVKRGLPVVLSTGTITDYDFVVNQNDQTFRLPLLNGNRVLVKKYVNGNAWYNLYSDGWLEQGGKGKADTFTINFLKAFKDESYTIITSCSTGSSDRAVRTMPSVLGQVTSSSCALQACPSYSGTFFWWFACGYAAVPTQSDFTEVSGLYYYVGETVQDASLINAGAVLGQLSNKADIDASNFTPTGKSTISGLGFLDTTKFDNNIINMTVTNVKQTYIAPANGHIYIVNETSTPIVVYGTNCGSLRIGMSAGAVRQGSVSIQKGGIAYILTQGGTATLTQATFYYAKGEV